MVPDAGKCTVAAMCQSRALQPRQPADSHRLDNVSHPPPSLPPSLSPLPLSLARPPAIRLASASPRSLPVAVPPHCVFAFASVSSLQAHSLAQAARLHCIALRLIVFQCLCRPAGWASVGLFVFFSCSWMQFRSLCTSIRPLIAMGNVIDKTAKSTPNVLRDCHRQCSGTYGKKGNLYRPINCVYSADPKTGEKKGVGVFAVREKTKNKDDCGVAHTLSKMRIWGVCMSPQGATAAIITSSFTSYVL